jgi:hypothetical protein
LLIIAAVPARPRAASEAERGSDVTAARGRRAAEFKTRTTVDQLLDRYLETLDVEPTTRTRY